MNELERLLGHKLTSVGNLRNILKEYDEDCWICVKIKGIGSIQTQSMHLFCVDHDPTINVVTLVFAEEAGSK